MAEDKKTQLVDLLDRKVFQPILGKNPSGYHSEEQKSSLKDVQQSTRSERKRFRDQYNSAQKVKDMYYDDLSSSSAQRIQEKSRELGLPTLPDVRQEFDQLCQRLQV